MRQPQARNWSPDQALKPSTARLARNSPQGTPNCGHEATSPRWPWVRDHSIASSTEPPHSPPTPMPWSARSTVRITAPQMPIERVGRHEGDEEGRDAHAQQRGDQRRLAADAIAVMAEDRGADRPRDEADEIGAEGEQRRRPAGPGWGSRACRKPGPPPCRKERSRTTRSWCRSSTAITALRSCALCSASGSVPYVVVAIAMASLPTSFLDPLERVSPGPVSLTRGYCSRARMAIDASAALKSFRGRAKSSSPE